MRDIAVKIIGMTPGECAGGGCGLAVDYAFADTPFGEVLVAATARGICALFFVDDRAEAFPELRKMFPDAAYTERMTMEMREVLRIFEEGDAGVANVTLHLKGTPFQMAVWRALLEIPQGGLTTYSEIAARVGRPKACRATGSAVGANPVSVIVPCHRVLRSTGGTGGYRWGTARKITLITNNI